MNNHIYEPINIKVTQRVASQHTHTFFYDLNLSIPVSKINMDKEHPFVIVDMPAKSDDFVPVYIQKVKVSLMHRRTH